MADAPKYDQDLTIINLNRFNKFDKPPQDGDYSKMSVSVFSNGKIRFNIGVPDNGYFGASLYPFELAVVRELVIPKLKAAVETGVLEDFKAVINVEKLDFRTKQASTTLMIVGCKNNVPYIGFKDASNKAMFPFTPINKVDLTIKGEEITTAHVAIIYAYSYFTDLLDSVNEAFLSMVNMGKNVTTLKSDTPSKSSDKAASVFVEDDDDDGI